MKEVKYNLKTTQRLDSYLVKEYPKLTVGLLNKFLRQNKIKINGKKQPLAYKLQSNDIITLYVDDAFFALPTQATAFLFSKNILDIVYEDDNILIVNKPSGIPVIDDNFNNFDTLINRVKHYYHTKGVQNSTYPQLCHRLDTGTQGLIVLAKNEQALNFILELFKSKNVEKTYLCVVSGNLNKKQGIQKAYLTKHSKDSFVTIDNAKSKNSKEIYTDIKILTQSLNYSLVQVKLITGRTHQIRAHLAFLNAPILGDSRYGNNALNRKNKLKYQCLSSYKIKFSNIENANFKYLENKEFTAQTPWFVNEFNDNNFI